MKLFSIHKAARPPTEEMRDRVAKAILDHLVSEGKLPELTSQRNAPYETFCTVRIGQPQVQHLIETVA